MSKLVTKSHIVSLTEWLASIHEQKKSAAMRREDNERIERLEYLNKVTGLPYERPIIFSATELSTLSARFKKVLSSEGHKLCALRLVPTTHSLPKLRQRGWTLSKCYHQWYLKQNIDPRQYIAYILPHTHQLKWSSTFIINKRAIFGEIIAGLHVQLSHGETTHPPSYFIYDFTTWKWSRQNAIAETKVKAFIRYLYIPQPKKQALLREKFHSTFTNGYLNGYFEANVWPNNKKHIIDYNRVLDNSRTLPYWPSAYESRHSLLTGLGVSDGIVKGKAVVVKPGSIDATRLPRNPILVCDNTDVRFLPLMKKAHAIVTNRGGMLSHPAIISRELRIPCIVNTGRATHVIKTGDAITVDGTHGIIKKT